ncbi:putative bifunctional diguanylate cyclase/phosphodiesterase [Alginatibacterium sediminis]|uniref:putative bifunctional diguanylate cyclase/phosphodiesterase n=1 Tax=Alginatibacterium sediminis TaxID=2164068 RepID=UPI001313E2A0|nr:EAL domain-containing protein [Alginatibacterium sediminis]
MITIRLFNESNLRQNVSLDISTANTLISRVSTAVGMVDPRSTLGSPRALNGSIVALANVRGIATQNNWTELVKNVDDSIDILDAFLASFSGPKNEEFSLLLHQQSLLQFNLLIEQLSIISKQYNHDSIQHSQINLRILAGLALWIISLVGIAAFYFYQRIIKPITLAKNALIVDDNETLNQLGKHSAIELKRLFNALNQSHDKLEHQANHDFLTGLTNRYHLNQTIGVSLNKAYESLLIILDIDNFKNINDTLGHESGDVLLKQVAERFKLAIGPNDTICRLGGDEFCIFISNLTPGSASRRALNIVNKVQQQCIEPYEIPSKRISISASMGIAIYPQDGKNYIELLRNADAAMYRAKSDGKSTFSFYTLELTQRAEEQMQIESDIMLALRERQFYLDYQVQWRVSDLSAIGVEALIRWKHPTKGLISPDKFIPIAESSWLIEGINDWVLTESIRQLAQWQKQGVDCPSMSINLSAMRFRNSALIEQISNLLKRYEVSAERLCLEITEHTFLDSDPSLNENLQQLRSMGIRISIDDFGTGYSSLSRLRNLPVDEIKIDRSFVNGIENEGDALSVFESMLKLCTSLSFTVVAEGVETQEQLNVLKHLNCDMVQGFYLARPKSPELVIAHFETNNTKRLSK